MIDNTKAPRKSSSSQATTPKTAEDTADTEPDFIPPDMIEDSAQPSTSPSQESASKKTSKIKELLGRMHWPRTKKGWVIFIGVILLILGLIVGSYFIFFHKKPAPKPAHVVVKKVIPPPPTTVASPLTGQQVSLAASKLPVTAVMIENSPDARPQSGLNSAGVVYEAVAEGGITRFLTLFQDNQAILVGPVRSARPYYLDWLLPFDASIAHVGGSPDALAAIKAQGIKDLDQFANSGSYDRINTRYAPHNVYTGIDRLVALEATKGYTASTFTGFPRKAAKVITPATATSIDMTISGYLYNTHYDFDAASDTYKRSEGGKPHLDEKSGVQIAPSVLVALVMNQGLMADGLHTTYGDIGSGKAYVFQDGGVQEGTWNKASAKAQFTFTTATGTPLKFNPGQTWLTVVGQATDIVHKP